MWLGSDVPAEEEDVVLSNDSGSIDNVLVISLGDPSTCRGGKDTTSVQARLELLEWLSALFLCEFSEGNAQSVQMEKTGKEDGNSIVVQERRLPLIWGLASN